MGLGTLGLTQPGTEHKGQGLELPKAVAKNWLDVMFGQVRVYLTSKKRKMSQRSRQSHQASSVAMLKPVDELDDLFN